MNPPLIDLLEQYRKEKRYSQAEMAELLGVSQPTYCRWISGQHPIEYQRFPSVARLLGLSAKDILPPDFK
jgi:transcriptional regulator with XRE-family HTH domain